MVEPVKLFVVDQNAISPAAPVPPTEEEAEQPAMTLFASRHKWLVAADAVVPTLTVPATSKVA